MNMTRERLKRLGPLLAVLGLAVFPLIVTDSYILHLSVLALIFGVLAASWDLTLGYGKVFNFAHPVFFAAGAYASAIVTTRTSLPPLLGLLIGAVAGSLVSIVVFVPVFSVRGNYVALISFAVTQLCLVLVISQRDITGGSMGLVGLPWLALGPLDLSSKRASFYVAAVLTIVSVAVMRRYVASKYGLGLIAAGLFEDYAKSRGISIGRVRLIAFIVSAAPAGAAGALYAHYIGVVSPELLSFATATLVVTMVLVGGVRSIYGPIVAAAILTITTESLGGLGPWRFVLISIVMAVTVILAPQGLWGALHRPGRQGSHESPAS
jgi:branched-chain amino acid transport system permease protein